MLIVCVALTSLVVVGQFLGNSDDPQSEKVHNVYISAAAGFTYVPLFVLGVLAVTTEYRHQTITPAVLATPSRWALISAKLISYALAGAVYAVVCVVVELAIALPWFASRGTDADLSGNVGALFSCFLVLALFALVGVGIGALVRNQIVAVTVGIAFLLIIDRLLLIIPVVKYVYPYTLDGSVGGIIARTTDRGARSVNGVHLLQPAGGIAVLVAWALITAALGAGLTMNRDIT
jgi:ABC-type transport system involved in multi-copper enzyme maturation permease subunit